MRLLRYSKAAPFHKKESHLKYLGQSAGWYQ